MALWDSLEHLVDLSPSLESLRAHRLQLAAARIWRSRGLTLPTYLRDEERRACMIAMAAPILLARARAAYGGQMMLMKGPEVAAWYREPSDRFFCDLDLLVDDAPAAQRALIASGFVEPGTTKNYDGAQHLCPLVWPGIPLFIELHRRPSYPPWLPDVSVSEVLKLAVPSATGVDGLLAPAPRAHALLLVAHSWTHEPLGPLAHLIDIAAVLAGDSRARTDELARHWGWDGMWRVSVAAANSVLGAGDQLPPLNIWARHLRSARERTVIESHIARLAAPACALPVSRAHVALASAIRATTARRENELWRHKLRRSGLALAHAFMQKSHHERALSRSWPG